MKKKSGFTLIELLVSVVIVSFIGGIIALFVWGLSPKNDASQPSSTTGPDPAVVIETCQFELVAEKQVGTIPELNARVWLAAKADTKYGRFVVLEGPKFSNALKPGTHFKVCSTSSSSRRFSRSSPARPAPAGEDLRAGANFFFLSIVL